MAPVFYLHSHLLGYFSNIIQTSENEVVRYKETILSELKETDADGSLQYSYFSRFSI